MEPLLEGLTLPPTAQLFELDAPKYTSSYGRRTVCIFKHNVPPAPMLLSPDNGLVLYERVISTKAENQLLDRLAKPKFVHAPRHANKTNYTSGTHHSPQGSTLQGPEPRPVSPGPGPLTAGTSSRVALPATGGPSRASSALSVEQSGASSASSAGAGGAGSRALSGRRSCSVPPGRARSAGTGGAPGAGAQGQPPPRRKPLYPEDGALKDYFSRERASVTATTVFTWGNRYKIGETYTGHGAGGGCGGGGGRAPASSEASTAPFRSHMPAQHKPPLRL